jgi:dipeptidyl aminopeptidase/acylaminoacyl peptidase
MQLLASRGFAVARFAVRGCYGFGRNFEKAADFQVDGKVVRDVEDGVRYLIRTGWADEKRIALLGHHSGGLVALRTAAASPLFRAVAVVDCWDSVSVEDIAQLTSSPADTNTIIGQLGGIEATYKAVRQLDPNTFLQSLSAPVLLAYTSEYASTVNRAIKLRHCFATFKKPYEWFEVDVRAENRTYAEYQAELYTKILDFLKRTL